MRFLILLTIVLIMAAIGLAKASRRVKSGEIDLGTEEGSMAVVAWPGGAAISGILLVLLLSSMWITVPAAYTAATYNPFGGGIGNADLGEGWHLIAPWVKVQQYSKRLQEYTMSIADKEGAVLGDDSMVCQTKEGLSVKIDATVVFRVPPGGGHTLWRNLGPDFVNTFIRSTTRNVVKLVVSEYGIMEVYSNAPTDYAGKAGIDFYLGKRSLIEAEITKKLGVVFKDNGLEMVMFLMRNVDYVRDQKDSDGSYYSRFEQSIVAKQVAQQSVTTQQYRSEQAQIAAQSKTLVAEGEARAIELKGRALAEEPKLVGLEWVEQLPKPEVKSDLSVIMLPKGGTLPLLHLNQNGAPAPSQ